MHLATLAILAAAAAGGVTVALLALRYPALLVVLSVYTVSLDHMGRLAGTALTANTALKFVLIGSYFIQMVAGDRRLRIPRHLLWFLPYLAFAAISSFYSADMVEATRTLLRWVVVWLFAVLVANLMERRWHLLALLMSIVVTSLIVSITAHLQTFNALTLVGVGILQKQGPDAGTIRALGTFWDSNVLGTFLAFLSLFMVGALSLPKLGRPSKALLLITLFIVFGAILLSYSRSAWLALIMGLVLFWRYPPLRPYVRSFALVGVLGIAYLILLTPYGQALLARAMTFTSLGQDFSGRFRWILAMSGLEIWSSSFRWLWGGGFASAPQLIWQHWYPLATHVMIFHSGTHVSHTLLTTLLADGGVIGVVLYSLHLVSAFKEAGRLRRLPLIPVAAMLATVCQVFVLVKVVNTFLNPSMFDHVFWLSLGLIGALNSPAFRMLEFTPSVPSASAGDHQK